MKDSLLEIFGVKEDELREILIAFVVIIFFACLVYFMGWFKTDNPTLTTAPDIVEEQVSTQENKTPNKDSDSDGLIDEQDKCPTIVGVKENQGCALSAAAATTGLQETSTQAEIVTPKIDTDGDGFFDEADQCPEVAGTDNGCPADTDNDGIIDTEDRCLDLAGIPENNGCPADVDQDGVYDTTDDCPTTFGVEANNGCPADEDNDSIPDTDDACPSLAGVAQNNGCPSDSDNDGVYDNDDACADVAGIASNDASKNGCPADKDNDGIADTQDNCPSTAGVAQNNGCPADTDNDGIADAQDNCPSQAGIAANQGCPELKITEAEQQVITEAVRNVQFFINSARPTEPSKVLLDKVADILKANPAYKLKISGHTDWTGDDALNLELSKKRAFTAFSHLVNAGIASKRLSHQGFGETQPIADNATSAGRRSNRRVEFELHY